MHRGIAVPSWRMPTPEFLLHVVASAEHNVLIICVRAIPPEQFYS